MSDSSRLKNKPGTLVRGSDFFGRELEQRELWDLLERASVGMLAARRVGKSSLLCRMLDQPAPGWRCIYLSLEALESESAFVGELLAEICALAPKSTWRTRLRVKLRDLMESLEAVRTGPLQVQLREEVGGHWRDDAQAALEILGNLEHRTVILLDEFPTFVQCLLDSNGGKARAKSFLQWFRARRLDPAQQDGRVRFLLTGSVGLDGVLRAAGMAAQVNDVQTYPLRPFSSEEAEAFVDALARGEQLVLNEASRSRFLELMDWPIPYYIQVLFLQVAREARRPGRELNVELVEQAFETLLSHRHRIEFDHWVSRLRETSASQAENDLKLKLLEAAARDRNGISSRTALQLRRLHAPELNENAVLGTLEFDGYISKVGTRYAFTSSLFRKWWLKWVALKP